MSKGSVRDVELIGRDQRQKVSQMQTLTNLLKIGSQTTTPLEITSNSRPVVNHRDFASHLNDVPSKPSQVRNAQSNVKEESNHDTGRSDQDLVDKEKGRVSPDSQGNDQLHEADEVEPSNVVDKPATDDGGRQVGDPYQPVLDEGAIIAEETPEDGETEIHSELPKAKVDPSTTVEEDLDPLELHGAVDEDTIHSLPLTAASSVLKPIEETHPAVVQQAIESQGDQTIGKTPPLHTEPINSEVEGEQDVVTHQHRTQQPTVQAAVSPTIATVGAVVAAAMPAFDKTDPKSIESPEAELPSDPLPGMKIDLKPVAQTIPQQMPPALATNLVSASPMERQTKHEASETEMTFSGIGRDQSSRASSFNARLGTLAATPDVARNVLIQVQEAVKSARSSQVELTLSPEELGRVRMGLSASDGTMVITLAADRAETLDLLRRHTDQLSREMQSLGFGQVSIEFGQRGTSKDEQSGNANANSFSSDGIGDPNSDTTSQSVRQQSIALGGLDIRI